MGEFRKRLCPSQFLEDGAQMNEQVATGCGGQRRGLRAQGRHPAEEMWSAVQWIDRAHLRMNGSKVSQELADGAAVVTSRVRMERGAERIDRAVQGRRQRMGGGRGPGADGAGLGSGGR